MKVESIICPVVLDKCKRAFVSSMRRKLQKWKKNG